MAGGMDWFRWYHGCVNDPKFRLVAARAGSTVAEVIAIWASMLEAASMADARGCAGAPDFDALDCSLGLREGMALAIFTAMVSRGLLKSDGLVVAWTKRQLHRERANDNSTPRVQAHRNRQRQEKAGMASETPRNASETPRNASGSQETPRGEERREEQDPSDAGASGGRPPHEADAGDRPTQPTLPKSLDLKDLVFSLGVPLLTAAGVKESNARSFLAMQSKQHGDAAVAATLERCAIEKPVQPVPWIQATLRPKPSNRHSGFDKLNYEEGIDADGHLT